MKISQDRLLKEAAVADKSARSVAEPVLPIPRL